MHFTVIATTRGAEASMGYRAYTGHTQKILLGAEILKRIASRRSPGLAVHHNCLAGLSVQKLSQRIKN